PAATAIDRPWIIAVLAGTVSIGITGTSRVTTRTPHAAPVMATRPAPNGWAPPPTTTMTAATAEHIATAPATPNRWAGQTISPTPPTTTIAQTASPAAQVPAAAARPASQTTPQATETSALIPARRPTSRATAKPTADNGE